VTRAEAASGGPFALGMTQADAAEELGTVREVLVRGIGTLRREGLIASVGRGRFEVRDLDASRRLAADTRKELAERREQAREMHLNGATFAQIAAELGCTETAVRQWICGPARPPFPLA